LIEGNLEEVNNWLNEWMLVLKGKKFWISRNKTEYIECEFEGKDQKDDDLVI